MRDESTAKDQTADAAALAIPDLAPVRGGVLEPEAVKGGLKAGASEVLMETVTMTCEVKAGTVRPPG